LTGALAMSKRQMNKFREHAELLTLITIFVSSVFAIAPIS